MLNREEYNKYWKMLAPVDYPPRGHNHWEEIIKNGGQIIWADITIPSIFILTYSSNERPMDER